MSQDGPVSRDGPVDQGRPVGHDISPAGPGDLETLLELEESCFEVREQWGESAWAGELRAGDRVVLVARAGDGGLLGAVSVRVGLDVADLHRVAVLGPERRRGLGRTLLERAFADGRARGVRTVLLEVRADNAAALSLYRALGFAEIDRRPGYYGRGSEAVVMRLRLGGARDD